MAWSKSLDSGPCDDMNGNLLGHVWRVKHSRTQQVSRRRVRVVSV